MIAWLLRLFARRRPPTLADRVATADDVRWAANLMVGEAMAWMHVNALDRALNRRRAETWRRLAARLRALAAEMEEQHNRP